MKARLLAGAWAGFCVAATLLAFDLARIPASAVPRPGGWSYLGEAVRLGIVAYLPASLTAFVLLAPLARLLPLPRGRAGSADGDAAAPLAGASVAAVSFLLALFTITGPGAPEAWLSAPWLLETGMGCVIALAAGAGAWKLARSILRARGGRSLALLGVAPASIALLASLPLAAAAGWPLRAERQAAGAGLPDIYLIVADTLRADAVIDPQGRSARTPVIQSLADTGVTFGNATAQASWTNPSTATILTGRMPVDHGMRGYSGSILPEVRTLAEILRARGYETVGITANPLVSRVQGFSRGFDFWDEEPGEGLLARHPGSLAARILQGVRGGTGGPFRTLSAEQVVDRILPVLSRPRPGPLFAYVHFMDPHDPYGPPAGSGGDVDPGYEGSLTFGPETLYGILRGEIRVSARDIEHARALYHAEIEYMDGQIGRLLRDVRPAMERGDAVVSFTSDHGEEFMEHGQLGHEHTLYQELIHVPWILTRPGHLPAGVTIGETVSHLDLLPTLLTLAGLPAPAGLPGRSLTEALRSGGALPEPHTILSEEDYTGYRAVSHRMRAVREGPWKVILSSPNVFGLGPWRKEVFDLAADPRETSPVEEPPPEALAAEGRLAEWIRTVDTAPGSRGPLDPETERRLRALGYIE